MTFSVKLKESDVKVEEWENTFKKLDVRANTPPLCCSATPPAAPERRLLGRGRRWLVMRTGLCT